MTQYSGYLTHLLVLAGIYVMLASSLNLIAGYGGLLSVAHAGFYGVGAYTAALLSAAFRIPFVAEVIIAAIVASVLGSISMLPALKIRGDYFVIATFALQVVLFNVFNNFTEITGGPLGITGIPAPTLFGFEITGRGGFLLLVLIACAVELYLIWRLVESPIGRILRAIREDEVLAAMAGKNVAAQKVQVFAISAALAAISGVIYAHYISFIDPTSFNVSESILIISMVIIGGAGNVRGPIVGALTLVLLPESLRFLGISGPAAANVRQILYGSLLLAFMLWRPTGLAGEYAFQGRKRP